MKRLYGFIVLLALAAALSACGPKSTPTPTPLPPTATPVPPTAIPPLSLGPVTEATIAPGGIEVAMGLVVIPDKETIAIVGDENISMLNYQQELNRALSYITSYYGVDWNDPEIQSYLPTLQEQVLDQVIDRSLLRQVAQQEGITIDPEKTEAEVVDLQADILESGEFSDWASFLTENGLTEESIRALMAEGLMTEAMLARHGGSTTAEQVHASHILVETEEKGQEVLDKLDQGEDFAKLAAEYSIDTGSKGDGGDLGWFPRGMMVSEFEEAAFALKAGETSSLVKSDYGYHIIRVIEKGEKELDEAFYEQVQQQQYEAWLEAQKVKISVKRLYIFSTP
ncbi:MAG: peptidylprolyl isomerase [Thermoflexales bacterium]|nr:peptidylprolyl isomerase [Thermoflexales bacterium]